MRKLHQGGAQVLPETDTPNQFIVPGFSVHEELRNLVDAGFTPYEAIKAATSDAAQFLKSQDQWGTTAIGRQADLILLHAHPLANVDNVGRRAGVMVRGRWLREEELQGSLERLASSYVRTTEVP